MVVSRSRREGYGQERAISCSYSLATSCTRLLLPLSTAHRLAARAVLAERGEVSPHPISRENYGLGIG